MRPLLAGIGVALALTLVGPVLSQANSPSA
jgi:hypothetical protein